MNLWERIRRETEGCSLGGKIDATTYELRHAWQRAWRGHDDLALWNLNTAIAELIVAGTTYMIENGHGHPADLTMEMWERKLRFLRNGFEAYLDKSFETYMRYKDDWEFWDRVRTARLDRSMTILKDYFQHLWD